jgi:hypothetical protein
MKLNALEVAAMNAVAEFGMLRFFPTEEPVKSKIVKLLMRLASRPDQIEWLVEIVTANYNDWPGPEVLRGIFCTRFAPADGRESDLTEGPYARQIEQRAAEQPDDHLALPPASRKYLTAAAGASEWPAEEPAPSPPPKRPASKPIKPSPPERTDVLIAEARKLAANPDARPREKALALEILSRYGVQS